MQHQRHRSKVNRQGFTILESVIAIMLLSIAATMVFSATFPAVNQAYQNRNQAIARQFSQHLLNEMLQLPLDSATPSTGVVTLGTPYQARDSFNCIRHYDGYASHMCQADGSGYESLYSDSEIATSQSIGYSVTIEDVDASFAVSGSGEYLRITISSFLDPDQNLQADGRPDVFTMTHLIGQAN